MDSVRRAEFLAKPKVKAAVATIAEVLREVVAGGTSRRTRWPRWP